MKEPKGAVAICTEETVQMEANLLALFIIVCIFFDIGMVRVASAF